MARPLRIELAGGWYHLTARGNERQAIFRDDQDRLHFLGLLAEWVDRFHLRVHAYVLMDNHYHLLIETAEANLSQAMQWLGVSYTVWFNRRHQRVGHLFQGRYQAIHVEAESAAWEVSRYVHLNPVRVRRLGLGKHEQAQQTAGMSAAPDQQQVQQRVTRLRTYRWSSYRAYAGLAQKPGWLTTDAVLRLGGLGSGAQRQRKYRREVETTVRKGLPESPWERLEAQVLLGGRGFVSRMRGLAKGSEREQPELRGLRRRPGWGAVVAAVEQAKGERWEVFRDRHGDWGRDVALYLGRQRAGLRLKALGELAGGLDYSSVQVAVRRMRQRLARDRQLRRTVRQIETQLYDDET